MSMLFSAMYNYVIAHLLIYQWNLQNLGTCKLVILNYTLMKHSSTCQTLIYTETVCVCVCVCVHVCVCVGGGGAEGRDESVFVCACAHA